MKSLVFLALLALFLGLPSANAAIGATHLQLLDSSPTSKELYGYYTSIDGPLLAVSSEDTIFVYWCSPTCTQIFQSDPLSFLPGVHVGGDMVFIVVPTGITTFQCDSSSCTQIENSGLFAGFSGLLHASDEFVVAAGDFAGDIFLQVYTTNPFLNPYDTIFLADFPLLVHTHGNYVATFLLSSEVIIYDCTVSPCTAFGPPVFVPGGADSIFFSGSVLIVGNSLFNSDQGMVTVYNCDGVNDCTQVQQIFGNELAFTNFGSQVQFSGTTLIVGAHDLISLNGVVYVYTCSPGCLLETQFSHPNAFPGNFGFALSYDGALLAVGAPSANVNGDVNLYAVGLTGCPAGVYDHAIYETTEIFETARGTCQTGYASVEGQSYRDCFAGNIWSNKPRSRCLTIKCQPETIDDRHYPLKGNRRISTQPCPVGMTGKVKRRCSVTGDWEDEKFYCKPI